MDARDMRDMEHERRLRDGKEDAPWRGVAGFEQHTKVSGIVYVCVCVLRACVHACVRACVHACVRVVCACVRVVCACVHACVRACVRM